MNHGSAHAAGPSNQELPVEPGIIDAIVQPVTDTVRQRLASIPRTNMISSIASWKVPQLSPPCTKPLSRQHRMQYPGTKLLGHLSLLPRMWLQPAPVPGHLGEQFIGDKNSSSGSLFLWGLHILNRCIISLTDNEPWCRSLTSIHAKVSFLCFSHGN